MSVGDVCLYNKPHPRYVHTIPFLFGIATSLFYKSDIDNDSVKHIFALNIRQVPTVKFSNENANILQ